MGLDCEPKRVRGKSAPWIRCAQVDRGGDEPLSGAIPGPIQPDAGVAVAERDPYRWEAQGCNGGGDDLPRLVEALGSAEAIILRTAGGAGPGGGRRLVPPESQESRGDRRWPRNPLSAGGQSASYRGGIGALVRWTMRGAGDPPKAAVRQAGVLF